MMQELVKSS